VGKCGAQGRDWRRRPGRSVEGFFRAVQRKTSDLRQVEKTARLKSNVMGWRRQKCRVRVEQKGGIEEKKVESSKIEREKKKERGKDVIFEAQRLRRLGHTAGRAGSGPIREREVGCAGKRRDGKWSRNKRGGGRRPHRKSSRPGSQPRLLSNHNVSSGALPNFLGTCDAGGGTAERVDSCSSRLD